MNNITLLEKENMFNHMEEHIEMGLSGSELLAMNGWGMSHGCELGVRIK
jgi:hypothetical protein